MTRDKMLKSPRIKIKEDSYKLQQQQKKEE